MNRIVVTLAAGLVVGGSSFCLAQNKWPQFGVLPPIETVTPKDNPSTKEKIELGRMLFFDPRLSGDGATSCATCHAPKTGWTQRDPLSQAHAGTKHWRSVSSVLNAAYRTNQFWDGRAASLEEQAKGPVIAPIEMNQNPAHLVEKLAQIPWYEKKFKEVFGSPISFDNMAKAIAAFERTVVSKNVPFDRYISGDESALKPEQVAGLRLFTGKAMCVSCHYGPALTDHKFHALGVPETEPLRKDSDRIATRHFFARDQGYKDYQIPADYGRELITKDPTDRYRFATPSLREVAVTAPYAHNGAFAKLEEMVEFLNKGGGDLPNKDPLIRPLNLTTEEKAALVAFLQSLSGEPIVIDPPELPKKGDGTF